jgi:hypothetical protein
MGNARRVIKRLRFPLDIMLLCVRWYVAYGVESAQSREMMQGSSIVCPASESESEAKERRHPLATTKDPRTNRSLEAKKSANNAKPGASFLRILTLAAAPLFLDRRRVDDDVNAFLGVEALAENTPDHADRDLFHAPLKAKLKLEPFN